MKNLARRHRRGKASPQSSRNQPQPRPRRCRPHPQLWRLCPTPRPNRLQTFPLRVSHLWPQLPPAAPPTAAPAPSAHTDNSQPAAQQATPEPNAPSAPQPTPFIPSTETDRQALVDLYEATDGSNWTSNDNWLTDRPLGDWFGVTTDRDRVTELDLAGNGLSGHIPETLGHLHEVNRLYLEDNSLTGQIPPALAGLRTMDEIDLSGNQFTGCLPYNLYELPIAGNSDYGALALCPNPDREALTALYNATGGPQWTTSTNWNTDQPLSDWYGVQANDQGRVIDLNLVQNNLRGQIPAELSNMEQLRRLNLGNSAISGWPGR